MKQYAIIIICLSLFACVTPVKYEELNTIEDRIAAAQAELKSAVETSRTLINRGVIQKNSRKYLDLKLALSQAEEAIQAAITALSLGKIVDAENQQVIFINALYAIREVLDE